MTRVHYRTFLLGILAAAGVAGCVSPAPVLEGQLGNSVLAARAQQTINPEAPRRADPVSGINGTAAQRTIDRYNDSFKSPPASVNVFNIGLGG